MIVYQSGIMFNYYRRPTGFWMTNPLVYFTNNVAAGGEGSGIWFVFPDEPLVPSREFKLMGTLYLRVIKHGLFNIYINRN